MPKFRCEHGQLLNETKLTGGNERAGGRLGLRAQHAGADDVRHAALGRRADRGAARATARATLGDAADLSVGGLDTGDVAGAHI